MEHLIAEVRKCMATPRAIEAPHFDREATSTWHELYRWSGQVLHPLLPEIRNGEGDAIALQAAEAPGGSHFKLVFHFREAARVPAGLGRWVNKSVRVSGDANEIRALLAHAKHGELLLPLCDVFGPGDDWVED